MKTIKQMLITIVALLCSVAVSAHDFEVDGIFYQITSTKDLTVAVTYRGSNYNSYKNEYFESVVIPENVVYNRKIYSITSIGEYAFLSCSGLTSVTIPNSVTSIGSGAFSGCTNLTNIEIPNSVTSIGSGAFGACTNLTNIEIPNSVTSIGGAVFNNCSSLTSITIPNSVTSSIGDDAFYFCENLTSVIIGNSVTSIGKSAFSGCTSLTSIEIPNSVTSIGDNAFYSCDSLANVVIGNGVTSIGEFAFYRCGKLKSIAIGSSVTRIERQAFEYCSALTSVTIPNSVTYIGDYAFEGCKSVKELQIEDSEETLSLSFGIDERGHMRSIFCDCPLETVYLGRHLSYDHAGTIFGEQKLLSDLIIGKGVSYIGEREFSSCTGLKKVEISNSVKSIEEEAFKGCSALRNITIPTSVTNIGNSAFAGCTRLTRIAIPDSVTSMGREVFYGCNSLANVTIGKSLVKIESYAFHGCSNLNSIIIPNSVTCIGSGAFCRCDNLTNVTIGSGVTNIEFNAFANCTRLTSITIPNSVTSIDDQAFLNCNSLRCITIPSSVTNIGNDVFQNCTGLKKIEINCTTVGRWFNHSSMEEVVIGNSVTSIGDNAFYSCDSLANVVIGNSVTSIGKSAFSGCRGLTSITIPNSVTSIGESAFTGCTSLTSIEIPNSVTSIGELAFVGCNSLANVIIGNNVTSIGDYAFVCYNLEKVVSENRIPPIANSGTFSGVPTNAKLYVPYKTKDKYAISDGWSRFKNNIIEFRKSYKAAYYIDGKEYAAYDIKEGDSIIYPKVKEREGYTFNWDKNIDIMPSNDIVIEGAYSLNNYAVIYKIDGVAYATDSVAYGSKINLRDIPVKNGYTFSGWSKAPEIMPANDILIEGIFTANIYTITYNVDGEVFATDSVACGHKFVLRGAPIKEGYTFSGWSEAPATMPAEDITVSGTFTINSYKVSYVVDGEAYDSTTVIYGSEIKLIEVPTKEGHTFSGWSEAPATMPAEDITISGTFAVNSYKVTYMVDDVAYDSTTVVYGSEIKQIEVPAKEGHTFSGWSETPATMPAKDITVSGTFTINSYKVTYIVDGEVYDSTTVVYGSEIKQIEVPAKEGHTFSGWSEAPATMPAKDITINGAFTVNSYKVAYIVDGKAYYSTAVTYGSEIKLIEVPTKEGYTFSGWSEAPATMPAEDITVSGTFAVNSYMVTYMVDGVAYDSTTVAYGDEITMIDAPTKEGHTFSGWSEAPATMPAKDITINGTFSINYYTLTYIVDGEIYKEEQVAYGSGVVLIDAPIKENYIFSGWSDYPATMPAENVTIKGSFIHTNISGVSSDATVKVNGNSITLSGANNSSVAVYTTNGSLVENIDSYTGEEIMLEKGVYIIRIGNKTMKVKL